jgi:hypothetical protein
MWLSNGASARASLAFLSGGIRRTRAIRRVAVAQLLGGADYGTITGWYRSEMGSVYGPLLIAAVAITGASAGISGEEEDRILGRE